MTVSINQRQTPSSSDDMTDYIIMFAHQYNYNSRGLLQCRYSSFISIITEAPGYHMPCLFSVVGWVAMWPPWVTFTYCVVHTQNHGPHWSHHQCYTTGVGPPLGGSWHVHEFMDIPPLPGVHLSHPAVVAWPQYCNITALGSNTNNPMGCQSAQYFLMQIMECYTLSFTHIIWMWAHGEIPILFFIVACTPCVPF